MFGFVFSFAIKLSTEVPSLPHLSAEILAAFQSFPLHGLQSSQWLGHYAAGHVPQEVQSAAQLQFSGRPGPKYSSQEAEGSLRKLSGPVFSMKGLKKKKKVKFNSPQKSLTGR